MKRKNAGTRSRRFSRARLTKGILNPAAESYISAGAAGDDEVRIQAAASPRGQTENPEMVICSACTNNIRDASQSQRCMLCLSTLHSHCSGLQGLKEDIIKRLRFICNGCAKKVSKYPPRDPGRRPVIEKILSSDKVWPAEIRAIKRAISWWNPSDTLDLALLTDVEEFALLNVLMQGRRKIDPRARLGSCFSVGSMRAQLRCLGISISPEENPEEIRKMLIKSRRKISAR